MAPRLQRCAHCKAYSGEAGGTDKGLMQVCGGCHDKAGQAASAYTYCNKKCQKAGWKNHKDVCRILGGNLDAAEVAALGGTNRVVAMRQLETYAKTFSDTVTTAMESGMSVDSPSGVDLASTHICLISVRWAKNVKLPIEKEFKVTDVEVLTHQQYEARSSIIPRVSTLRATERIMPQVMGHAHHPESLEVDYRFGRGAGPVSRERYAIVHMVFMLVEKVRDGDYTAEHMTMAMAGTIEKSQLLILKKPDDLKWKEHLIYDLSRPPRTAEETRSDQLLRIAEDIDRPEVRRYFQSLQQRSRPATAEETAKFKFMQDKDRERLDKEARKREQSK